VHTHACRITNVSIPNYINSWGRRGRDRMVVGFTNTCAINAYYH